jgi:hypothetical protein
MYAVRKTIFTPFFRPFAFRVVYKIFYNFFYRQFIAAFFPGKIPVSKVDHPLDEKIPFKPTWIKIYIDFTQFWIRVISFYIRRYGRKEYKTVGNFIESVGELYVFAAQVYTKNLSTTKRPFYISNPRFLLIHLADPHLMCVPSLHIMLAVHTYLQFKAIARKNGEEEKLKPQIKEMKQGALAISQAVLFVKQHSVNCIPAALYAMTCFTPDLFPPEEAESFTNQLFSAPPIFPPGKNGIHKKIPNCYSVHPAASPKTKIPDEDQALIKSHIISLYNRFMQERDELRPWYEPLVKFLKEF